ncbi:MAG: stage II sporulation protein M [Aristaeellaceae bacterium]
MENIKASQRDSLKRSVCIAWLLALALILASACAGYALQRSDGGDAIAVENAIPAMDIYRNNLAMLGMNVLGAFLLGIPNLISGLMNGYALGSFACIAARQFGTKWILRSILPHGWLEIPVILIAVSFGALPWIYIGRRLRCPERSRRALARQLGRYLCVAALACAAALLLAAVIEANISMKLG